MTDAEEFILSTYQFVKTLSCSNINRVTLVKSTINGNLFIRRDIPNNKQQVYQILKNLNLESIPKIYEVIYDGNTIVIEEYIEGETLEKKITDKKNKLDIHLLITNVLMVLKQLHNNNIIHLDIKAENIILKSDGTPVLIDFALAKMISPCASPDENDNILGTIGSAAPEQFGLAPTDQRSDIYSLGRLCEVLLHTNTVSLSPASRQMWTYIIEKCTAFKPENRFQHVEEILSILAHPEFLYDNRKDRIIPFLHTQPLMCLQMSEGESKTFSLPWHSFEPLQLHLQDTKEGICLTMKSTPQKFIIFPRLEISSIYPYALGRYTVEVIFFAESILFALEVYTDTKIPLAMHTRISRSFMARQLFYKKCEGFIIGELYHSISGFAILGEEEVLLNRETLHSYPLTLEK